MSTLLAILGAIAAIVIITLIHEYGHFRMARWVGVKVIRFSIGFGKPLLRWQDRKGTEFVLSAILLGGYVKMAGEGDPKTLTPDEQAQAYQTKPLLARMAIVLAGPAMNMVLAVVALWAALLFGVITVKPIVAEVLPNSVAASAGIQAGDRIQRIGVQSIQSWRDILTALAGHLGDKDQLVVQVDRQQQAKQVVLDLAQWKVNALNPDLLKSLGLVPVGPTVTTTVAGIVANSPAAKSQLKAGDKIVQIGGQKITSWQDLQQATQKHANKTVTIIVQNQQGTTQFPVTLDDVKRQGQQQGFLGVYPKIQAISPTLLQRQYYNVFTAWVPAVQRVWQLITLQVSTVEKLITGNLSLKMLSGPITIVKTAGQASLAGWQTYLAFIALISLAIGFINLLPIPGLDGGHFLFQCIEAIIRRPVPLRYQSMLTIIGMGFVVYLILQATSNDILRLLSGG